MKNLFTICCLLMTLAGLRAATLTGSLSNGSFSTSVSGYKVYLYDSLGSGYGPVDSAISGPTGGYTLTIPTSSAPRLIYLLTTACGAVQQTSTYYSGAASVTLNFTICPLNPAVASIVDTIRNSTTNAPVFGLKVYLQDSTATSFYRDSAYTDRNGVVSLRVPSSVAPGNLKIYTAPPCGITSQTVAYNWLSFTAPTMLSCASNPVVSGTITNLSNSTPVKFHDVIVTDSFAGALVHYDSTATDGSGNYSVALAAAASGHTITASVQGCGSRTIVSSIHSGANMTLNMGICATSTATISGTLYNAMGTTPVVGHKVYLIDTISATSVYIDSTVTSSTATFSFTIPPYITSGYFQVYTLSCGVLQAILGYRYNGQSATTSYNVYPAASPTFSGTIYNMNGSVAPGIGVTVRQVASPWNSISTTSSATGAYSMMIPCNWGPSGSLELIASAGSCGARSQVIVSYTGNSIVQNDTVCPRNPFGISGIVRKQGGGSAPNAKVYAIDEYQDSTTMITTLRAFDSTTTNAQGRYYLGRTTPTPWYVAGLGNKQRVLLKAALQSSDPAYLSFLPTYHDTALNWSAARGTYDYYQWNMQADTIDISLRSGSNPGGPGFIGGNVMMGANKTAGAGDPLPARILILTTQAGKPVGFTYSNAAGKFSFPPLPFGSYYLFGDAGGRSNPQLAITLSAGQPQVANVVFEENSTSFEGRFANVGVETAALSNGLQVYPNPAGNEIRIAGITLIPGAKTVKLRTVNGSIVKSLDVADGADALLPVTTMPAGLYLVEIRTATGVHNLRFVKK